MNSLADIDQRYRDVLAESLPALREVRKIIDGSYEFDLSKRDVSEAVLKRLKCFYETQQAIKQLLNKRYQTAGADFFVESVIFFFKLTWNQLALT